MKRSTPLPAACATILVVVAFALSCAGRDAVVHENPFERALGFHVLPDGSIVVTDGGGVDWTDTGSQVLRVDRSGAVLFRVGGLRFAHAAIGLADGNVLVCDTNRDRLVAFAPDGSVAWSSESWGGGTGRLSDGTELRYPNSLQELPNGRLLVSDRDNGRILELDRDGTVYWKWNGGKRQHGSRRLPDGHTLFADSDGNRVVELDADGREVWSYAEGLRWPRFAQRLEGGNTLITDSNNNRVIEVSPDGKVVWQFGPGVINRPFQAERLANGNTLIADAQHGRLVEVDRSGRVVWEYARRGDFRARLDVRDALPNGGAEEVDADDMPIGWKRCDLVARGTGEWAIDRDVARSGEASFRISAVAGRGDGLNKYWGSYLDPKGSGTLVLSGWVRSAGVKGGAGIGVTFIDAMGGIVGGVNSKSYSGDVEWTHAILTAPIPPGTAWVSVGLSLVGSGIAWFDDVELAFK